MSYQAAFHKGHIWTPKIGQILHRAWFLKVKTRAILIRRRLLGICHEKFLGSVGFLWFKF